MKRAAQDYSVVAQAALKASEEAATSKPTAGLYLVATPIGHSGDITLRALHLLAQADFVACEDTRVTGTLLTRYGIKAKLLPYHDHNAERQRPALLDKMLAGNVVVLVSDAGTPLIADPGYKLVQACLAEKISVTSLPGANAVLTALQLSGLPSDQFFFGGFLPAKTVARRQAIAAIKTVAATLIFYEAPSRITATLQELAEILGDRPAAVARELTKMFEEVRRGNLADLAKNFALQTTKGECVIMVGAAPEAAESDSNEVDALLRRTLKTHSVRDAAALVTAATAGNKRDIYARALSLAKKR
jgi:16S rRNA (cytidine1402-2'-O)-methyltransferase